MLYVTTRNLSDTYTAHRALSENRGPDGGLFIPFHLPRLTEAELNRLYGATFNQCLAEILNRFCQTKLTKWDLDFGVGRYPVRIQTLNGRILIGECWHNSQWTFKRLVHNISGVIFANNASDVSTGIWLEIAVRISVLFGIFSELKKAEVIPDKQSVDVSVVSGSLSAVVSTWYAREMGLPIENIVCCCNENSSLWDLFTHGQFRTDVVCIKTSTPEADITLPECLETLISLTCGVDEVNRYLEAYRRGGMYCPDETTMEKLRKGIHVSVVSDKRVKNTIPNVYGTNSYLLSPYASITYSGLMDYRAKTGESRPGLILSEIGPARDTALLATAMNSSEEEIIEFLNKM